jgi:tetratricopeptide (TPR) repeat protein
MAGLELARCRERGDSHAAAIPLFATGATFLATGELDRAGQALTEALALFRAGDSALGEALALERLGVLQDARGQTVEAMEALADAVVVAERAPLRRHLLVRILVTQAHNRLAAGSLHSAEVIAREAADCAVRHGVCSVCEASLRPLTVRIALARDRLDDAGIEASILESVASSRGSRALRAISCLTRARIDAALGRKEEALSFLGEARETFTSLGRRYDLALCARLMERLGAPRDPGLDGLLPPDAAMLD